MPDLAHPKGDYGIDAPYVPLILAGAGVAWLILGVISAATGGAVLGWVIVIVVGLGFIGLAGWYVYVTRRGKFEVWASLLSRLELRGDERLLDLGCGRGAVLLQAAKLLPRGEAVGIDLWKTSGQSGNAQATTERNADLEGVRDRIRLETGDMTALPFDDASCDVVVSSLAIHNIRDPSGREGAIREGARVLKPGGALVIADIRATRQYEQVLRDLGWSDVQRRGLGARMWFGLFNGSSLVRARKPDA